MRSSNAIHRTLAALGLAALMCGCIRSQALNRELPAAPAQNRAIVLAVIERAWNTGDFRGLDTLLAPVHLFHFRGRVDTINIVAFQRTVTRWRTGLSDFRMVIEDVVTDRDRVAVRATMRGLHAGPLLGMPASGRPVSTSVMIFARVANNRIVEIWEDYDEFGLRRQLATPDSTPF